MKNTIAVITVALLGIWIVLSAFWSLPMLFSGGVSSIAVFLTIVLAIGIGLIALRRPLGAWLVSGVEGDTGALAVGIVRAFGLLLLFAATRNVSQVITYTSIPNAGGTPLMANVPVLAGVALANLAAAALLLVRAVPIARTLDAGAEESPRAVHIQSILFGAIALAVLVVDVPELLKQLFLIWREVNGGNGEVVPGSVLWSMAVPEGAAALIRVAIAVWLFAGRDRIAGAWHRLHPMGAE
jgi:hypothetical protein